MSRNPVYKKKNKYLTVYSKIFLKCLTDLLEVISSITNSL